MENYKNKGERVQKLMTFENKISEQAKHVGQFFC